MRYLFLLGFLATASAQIPSLGWCPDYQAMPNFNINRFLGTWYEAERYFTVTELGSRCVTTHFTATPEGRILITNEITNSLTGFKRMLEGHLQMIGREGEGHVLVKYSSAPMPYDFEYHILDTDYDNYAVLWSCSGIGPVHTQNTWVVTRERIPNLATMQSAYAVIDRFKISRLFFQKTNQADCTILPQPAALSEAFKNVDVVPAVVPPKEGYQLVERSVEPEAEAVPELRSAIASPENMEKTEEAKPMQVPELIMSEMEKKGEKMEMDKIDMDKMNMDKMEMEKMKMEKMKAEKIKMELEKMKAEKMKMEMTEMDKMKAEKMKMEMMEMDKMKAEKMKMEMMEMDKMKAEKMKMEMEKMKAEKMKMEMEKMKAEKMKMEKMEMEKMDMEKKDMVKKDMEKKDMEKMAPEKMEMEKMKTEMKEKPAL